LLLVVNLGCGSFVSGLAGDAVSGVGLAVGSDDDPELVRAAIPFGLKMMEALLVNNPDDVGLLLAAASGFVQYAYAFVQPDAERLDSTDPEAAQRLLARARRLYARARGYGLRGLEAGHAGFQARLLGDRAAALAEMEAGDVPLLYWTAAAWGAEISISKHDMLRVGELPVMEALMERAFVLDPDWSDGALHEFYISYDGGRAEAAGGSIERARQHYERALALSDGKKVGPRVTWAEVVSVQRQNRQEFNQLLEEALAMSVDDEPRFRLVNIIAQNRARWLLTRADDLFLE
jgi:predicted anti-sigma-YlaC factor YlaD